MLLLGVCVSVVHPEHNMRRRSPARDGPVHTISASSFPAIFAADWVVVSRVQSCLRRPEQRSEHWCQTVELGLLSLPISDAKSAPLTPITAFT